MPFSYEKACDIAEDFADLEGTGISVATEEGEVYCIVKELVIVTVEGEDQHDVLIKGNNPADDTELSIPIQDYINAMGIRYNFL